MIILTGGAGFIGTNTLDALNAAGRTDVVVVDALGDGEKWRHLGGRRFRRYLHRTELWDWLADDPEAPDGELEAVIHLGANTDTTEEDVDRLLRVNTDYSRRLWRLCADREVPLVWASSAATYGDGSAGFSDRRDTPEALAELEPLNPYGLSKHRFDAWAVGRAADPGAPEPPRWAGLKFFNVYGPHEGHKGAMASYVHQAILQAREHGRVRLFRSTRPGLEDGEQARDFVWVEDVVDVVLRFAQAGHPSGLYNVGTGRARTFNELVDAIGRALGRGVGTEYFEMPEEVRGQYQHFTEADTEKLAAVGAAPAWTPLEEGVERYVRWIEDRDPG